jgi:hypothetical protein
LDAAAPLPAWATRGAFHAIVRAPSELSVVCLSADVPGDARAEKGWRCLRLAGPIPFTETGVLVSVAAPLADAGVGIFAISSFDTDYVLVPAVRLAEAVAALEAAGHRVTAR